MNKSLLADAQKNYGSLLRLVIEVAEIALGSQEDTNVAKVATLIELSILIGTMFVHDMDCATENEIDILAILICYLNIWDFCIFDKLEIVVEVVL